MILHHIAFWTTNIERLKDFYINHCQGKILFSHQSGDFRCVFLEIFGAVKIEIMTRQVISPAVLDEKVGFSHFSIEVETEAEVNNITDYCCSKSIPLKKNKEQYDDGFYESAFVDPDGNIIEIAYINRKVNPSV
jgi:catechol 2,3-dioxygenase-like lactoylglutathione lyase family enzyme